MAKEILIYSYFDSFQAEKVFSSINEAIEDSSDIVVRVNSSGGDPMMAFGMVKKFNEFEGSKIVKVVKYVRDKCVRNLAIPGLVFLQLTRLR